MTRHTTTPNLQPLPPTTYPASSAIDAGYTQGDDLVDPWLILWSIDEHELVPTEALLLHLITPTGPWYTTTLAAPGQADAPLYIAAGTSIPDPYRRTGPYIHVQIPQGPWRPPVGLRIAGTENSLILTATLHLNIWQLYPRSD